MYNSTLLQLFINILLFVLLLLVILIILNKFVTYLKFHIIKRHLYYAGNAHYNLFLLKLSLKLDLTNYINKFLLYKIASLYDKFIFQRLVPEKNILLKNDFYLFPCYSQVFKMLHFIIYKGHYALVISFVFMIFFIIIIKYNISSIICLISLYMIPL